MLIYIKVVIHFSATSENIKRSAQTYRYVCDIITDLGHTLSRDWIEEAIIHAGKKHNYTKKQAARIARKTREAIQASDLVILDVTQQSFSVGYQAAISVNLQKPILFIQKKSSKELGILGTSDESILKSFRWYSSRRELKSIIENFIQENSFNTKDLRFNMMLDRRTLKYIENESSKTGISKSQIVRGLIEKEIDKD